jgi:prophage regulatory protein
MEKTLRLPAVIDVTGLPESTIYERIRKGKFPKPLKLEGRAVGWLETEIAAWQAARNAERIAARDGEGSVDKRRARA